MKFFIKAIINKKIQKKTSNLDKFKYHKLKSITKHTYIIINTQMDDPYRIGRALNTKMHKVNEFLYIGNRSASEDLRLLKKEGIVKVLRLLDFYSPRDYGDNIDAHYIRMEDNEKENLERILPEALRYIHIAVFRGEKILVHCNAGVSRSGIVVIAYIMASQRIDFRSAYSFVESKRACVSPNLGFISQLKNMNLSYLISLIN